MELKDKLIQLRKDKRMTQADLAEALNISRQAVSRWETGDALPSTENLIELSKLYGVSVDAILDNDSIEEKATEKDVREEPTEQSKRWQNKKLAVVALVIVIITAVVGAAIGITKAQEQDRIKFEEMTEESSPDISGMDTIPIS